MTLAFYRANATKATFLDKFIALFSGGEFSHVELILGDITYGQVASSFSARPFTAGVGYRDIRYNKKDWELVSIGHSSHRNSVLSQCTIYNRLKYNYVGAILSIFKLNFNPSKTKWYCSEVVEQCLLDGIDGLHIYKDKSWQSTPNRMYKYLMDNGFKPM